MTDWCNTAAAVICSESLAAASARQQQLTKPPGSLGQLESLAVNFAGWQGMEIPILEHIAVRVYAADHGVTERNVSAFPAAVTVQMIDNFIRGGAAISVLSRQLNADFAVVNMGTFTPTPAASALVNVDVARGTRDFTVSEAMTAQSLHECLDAGRNQVDDVNCSLFIAGEMGIGNTTAAAAITAALLGLDANTVVGHGTGVDAAGLARKQSAVTAALKLHGPVMNDPLAVLRCVGGLEIAAMVGAYIRCAQRGIPVLLDGFIATAAALVAVRINPSVRDWMIAGHQSMEPAHSMLLEALGLRPLLKLGLRLGEGSGAALALGLIDSALLLHREMATFTQAGIAAAEEGA